MRSISLLLIALFISSVGLNATIITVNWDGGGDYTTIQEGIDSSSDSDTVLVYPGTYVENINYNGKNIVVASLFLTTQDTSYISQTIIDGNQNGSVVEFNNEEDSTTILTGFTITNGNAYNSMGGGIYCYNAHPVITNNIISNNIGPGGGICCCNSNLNITNNKIINNIATSPCETNGGGGIACSSSLLTIINNIICNNIVDFGYGGGIVCSSSSLNLISNTISNNSATFGGGIACGGSSLSLINCILWDDSSQEVYFIELCEPDTITISYSDIQGGEDAIITNNNGIVNWLGGNIYDDPLFFDPDIGDYHLTENSPCIDAGNPDTTSLNLPPFDLDGNPRIINGIIDMGCYESQGVGIDDWYKPLPDVVLYQNFPNPFSVSTTISFFNTKNTKNTKSTKIMIYNIKGELIKQLFPITIGNSNQFSIKWDGKNESGKPVSSGIYLYQLSTKVESSSRGELNNYKSEIKKMILIK